MNLFLDSARRRRRHTAALICYLAVTTLFGVISAVVVTALFFGLGYLIAH